jgi:hypothetical protein
MHLQISSSSSSTPAKLNGKAWQYQTPKLMLLQKQRRQQHAAMPSAPGYALSCTASMNFVVRSISSLSARLVYDMTIRSQ